MVEIAISVAAKVAEYLVAPIARPFGYIWNYKTNFDNLKIEVRKLEGQRDTVQHSVDEARRNGEQIEQHVSDWLDRVKTMTDEPSEVNGENERADMKCFKGLCPNPKKRYQHCRKAVKQMEAVARLYGEGSFPTVSFRTIPEETWIPSYKGYMVFESRMSTLKNILDALSNPDVNLVGIYGTGGIGKTMLAKEIAQHADYKKLFNVVAFAEVAVKPDIKEIQKEIADKLGLTFASEESVSGRARRLQQRLKQEEKVLLVLDNIWERLNLEEVGIPFGDDHKGCKLLLTARNLDVLSKMESHRDFEVGFLDKGEAWSLFEKKAGACDRLQALAKNVAEACGGLPIAINSVAVALKAKEEFEWKDALRKLTTPSAGNFEGVAAETYSSIEISYNQLKEKELKSTFLFCCIMEYTDIEYLLAYIMGLGIFEKVEAMEDARNRVNTLLRKLKDSSLLLDINDYRFSLHDVVRDVGTSIASRDWNMFRNCTIRELVDKDALKNCLAITLHNIDELPKEFECPELRFFYMSTTAVCRFPDNFFVGMPKLKVLHLVGRFDLKSMPNSIGLLVNLRTLYIHNCKLGDINFIGEFKQLEILRIHESYSSSKIEMIPKKMCILTGLRLLDLNHCFGIRNFPPNVLSTFTQLEELYLPSSIEWEVEGVNILDELKHLTHLTALEISIPDANVLPKDQLLSNKLERYEITFGSYVRSEFYRLRETSRRTVKLNLKSSSCSDDVQKFLSVLDTEGFPELEHLWVENSPGFRTVVDCLESESCHNHFLFLESLSLRSVFNLERIHNHQLRAESFQRLTTLEVVKCNKLKNVFSFSTYRALPLLQQVYVSSCDNIEEIFAINRREEGINNDEGTDQIEFKQLHFLRLESLPKLTSFCSINGNKDILDTPTPLFNQKVAFPSLEEIEISGMLLLDLEMIWPNQLCKDSFCNLNSLKVTKCNKLLTIFQSNMLERITRLESLTVGDCDLVEVIFDLQGVGFEEQHSEIETLLRKLDINGLPKLKHIWNKDPQKMFSYQKLSSVKVQHCMSLKYLFPVSIAESLSELQQLDLCSCGVEEIVGDYQREANVAATFVFPQITSLQLNYLPRLKTFYRGVHTSQWQNLKWLVMHGCDKVELFASELFNFQENKEGQHDNSLQPLFIVEKVTFPSVEEIKIYKSDNLKMVWHKRAKESFFNLKSMEIWKCNSLLTIFQFSMPRLLTVGVSGCALVEENFDLQKVNFEKLDIRGLPKLKHIWNTDPQAKLSFEELPRLKRLTVIYCDSIEEIFDLQKVNFEESHSRPVTYQLQELYISGLPKLKHIWKKDPQAKLFFKSLQKVEVYNCKNLKDVFPASIGRSLLQLVQLNVEYCGQVEEIVAKEGEAKAAVRFVFPEVTSIKLNKLPQLRTFYPGVHSSKWLVLKELEVVGCDKMELLASELFSFQENNEESHLEIPAQPPLFLVEKDSFQNLTILMIWHCNGLKNLMTSSTAKSLVQLREMKIGGCNSMIEVVAKEGDVTEEDVITFSKLRTLTLKGLPSLSCFCSENYTFELPSLEEIIVYKCPGMKCFSSRDVTTPILQIVREHWGDRRVYKLKGDLNTTIQQIQEECKMKTPTGR